MDAVNLHDRDTRRRACATDNGSVTSGRKIDEDCRFMRIGRGEAGGHDFRFLSFLPIIIGSDYGAAGVVQFESWILEWIRDTGD